MAESPESGEPRVQSRGCLAFSLEIAGFLLAWLLDRAASRKDSPRLESLRRRFEVTDADPRALAAIAFGLVLVLAVSMAALAGVYGHRIGGRSSSTGNGFRAGATQHTSIEDDWHKLDASVAGHLAGYRWIKKENGIVQIPIEKAMEIIAERNTRP